MDTAPSQIWLRRLTLVAIAFTAVVIILGAWTRLADAGLGCPDWPGCYGYWDVRDAHTYVDQVNREAPGTYREAFTTVPEMVHRYAAGTLGLLVLAITVLVWKNRRLPGQPLVLGTVLPVLVIFQALLGKWTVTMGLQPTIVMLHLMGGFTTMILLCWLAAKLHHWPAPRSDAGMSGLRSLGVAALAVMMLQSALGGWVAANYAAVACTELPICESGWTERLDFGEAFTFFGHEHDGPDYEFGVLEHEGRTTIHVMHRFGAIVAFVVTGALALVVFRRAHTLFFRNVGLLIGGGLLVQFGLGVTNVVMNIPLSVAVAHNFGAVVLLVMLVLFLRASHPRRMERTHGNY